MVEESVLEYGAIRTPQPEMKPYLGVMSLILGVALTSPNFFIAWVVLLFPEFGFLLFVILILLPVQFIHFFLWLILSIIAISKNSGSLLAKISVIYGFMSILASIFIFSILQHMTT